MRAGVSLMTGRPSSWPPLLLRIGPVRRSRRRGGSGSRVRRWSSGGGGGGGCVNRRIRTFRRTRRPRMGGLLRGQTRQLAAQSKSVSRSCVARAPAAAPPEQGVVITAAAAADGCGTVRDARGRHEESRSRRWSQCSVRRHCMRLRDVSSCGVGQRMRNGHRVQQPAAAHDHAPARCRCYVHEPRLRGRCGPSDRGRPRRSRCGTNRAVRRRKAAACTSDDRCSAPRFQAHVLPVHDRARERERLSEGVGKAPD